MTKNTALHARRRQPPAALALLLLCAQAAAAAAPSTEKKARFVQASSAFLRASASARAPQVSKLPIATRVAVDACSDGWCRVHATVRGQRVEGFIADAVLGDEPPRFGDLLNSGRTSLERACALRPRDAACLRALAALWRADGDGAKAAAVEEEAQRLESTAAGTAYPGKLAAVGIATHAGETPLRDGETALVLCGAQLTAARVHVERVEDAIVDAPGDKTGELLTVPGCDTATWAISLPELKPGRAVDLGAAPAQTSTPLKLTLAGRTQTLVARAEPDGRFTLTLDGTTIGRTTGGADGAPTLVWAGDVDGDGALDLIVDMSWHENVGAPTLFLSSAGKPGRPVAVAQQITTGC